MLILLDEQRYKDFLVLENGEKVIYVQVIKALYGMLQASLLFYQKLRTDLEEIGFKINPYDPCVANRIINGSRHTVTWHVDDLKSSHIDPKVNDRFLEWLEKKYGDKNLGSVKAVRGKIHHYLGMTLDYTTPQKVKLKMKEYIEQMIKEYPEEIKGSKYPWNDNLFKQDDKSDKLGKERAELFHTLVAKGLFLSKRARPDILPAITYLCMRVKEPNESDWFKLSKVIGFLKSTMNDELTIEANDYGNITWYVDAAFGVHKDMKSHTGAVMMLGKGCIQSISTKQKVNSRSSTEAELISMDDVLSKVQWTKLFMQEQGCNIKQNIIYRDKFYEIGNEW